MTLLDAYALVALLADEPAAGDVDELLRSGECGVVVANLAESIDTCRRIHGLASAEVRVALEPLLGAVLAPIVSGAAEAWEAAELRAAYYHRRTCALSLADCFLLAHAESSGDAIATADPPLADTARSRGVDVLPLPDSAGRRP